MPNPGTETSPLRVAIFGSGPAAFYAADALFKQTAVVVQIDMFERLPAPFGLVRYGVAPDHPKIKSVTKVYDGIAANKRFRFFGNVEFGKHLKLDELKQYYHQILFATGAQTDRKMGIPGEDLTAATPRPNLSLGTMGIPTIAIFNSISLKRARRSSASATSPSTWRAS
jgi:ferredoxin--NADP+ reductase